MINVAVIPARSGSKRLPKKNYKKFNSVTLVEKAAVKCLQSKCFDRVIITSDDNHFEEIAESVDVEFRKRPKELCDDNASTDKVVEYLFHDLGAIDTLIWVNSVSPLQTIDDIQKCSSVLLEENVDSVMAVNTMQQHIEFRGRPLNFEENEPFARTQDLDAVSRYVYSCMGWKRGSFLHARSIGNVGLLHGNKRLVEVSVMAGMLVKYQHDFDLLQALELALLDKYNNSTGNIF